MDMNVGLVVIVESGQEILNIGTSQRQLSIHTIGIQEKLLNKRLAHLQA